MGSKLILLLALSLIYGTVLTEATICDAVTTCSHFKHVRIIEEEDLSENVSRWENEPEIARTGSWDGVVPESYRLHLDFVNGTHYSGSVNIDFHLRQSTNRILINHGKRNPSVEYKSITIGRVCAPTEQGASSATRKRSAPVNTISQCIHRATFFEFNETLVLELTGLLKAAPVTRYTISFPKFEGRSGDEAGTIGATGLHESTVRGAQSIHDFSALSTMFQMRYARTVFPCFDQPSLKARFDLSITRPSTIHVASNTRSIVSQMIGTNRRIDRFLLTPFISTYVFTFALMENFTSETVSVPGGGPIIEIFAPTGTMDRFRWMFPEAVRTVQYFERITRVKFPLDRLAFLVVYPAPFWGVENFGLITVEGAFMEQVDSHTAYSILYHEIVHQWLGDVVTISQWKEICLQEGLTAYFEWYLSAQRWNGSLDETARSVRKEKNRARYYEPYALVEYKKTQDIADRCYGRPSLFFHPLTKRFGFQVLENFLAKLIEKKPYGTADIRLWDTTMEEVTRSPATRMTGYIEGWFLGPGTVHLLVSINAASRCLVIRQTVAREKGGLETPTRPRPLPFSLIIAQKPRPSMVTMDGFLRSTEEHVCQAGNAPMIVDADGDTFTRKAYTAELYKRVFETRNDPQAVISTKQMVTFVEDFCTVLLDDILPTVDEPPSTKPAEWLYVYDSVKNSSTMARESICSCCCRSKEEIAQIRPCKRLWNFYCKDLRLTKLVGREYSFLDNEL